MQSSGWRFQMKEAYRLASWWSIHRPTVVAMSRSEERIISHGKTKHSRAVQTYGGLKWVSLILNPAQVYLSLSLVRPQVLQLSACCAHRHPEKLEAFLLPLWWSSCDQPANLSVVSGEIEAVRQCTWNNSFSLSGYNLLKALDKRVDRISQVASI